MYSSSVVSAGGGAGPFVVFGIADVFEREFTMSVTRCLYVAMSLVALVVVLFAQTAYSQSFFDDFEDNNLFDGAPITWQSDRNMGTITAENGDMILTPVSTACCVSAVQDASNLFPHSDIAIDATFQFPTSTAPFVAVGFRDLLDGGTGALYWAGGFATGELAVGYSIGGSINTIKRGVYLPTGDVQDNADVSYHVEVIGSEITFSAWETLAGPEQAATIQWTDPSNRAPLGELVYPFINPNGSREPVHVRSFGVTTIPEPSGTVLAGLAILCFAAARRRI